MKNHFHSRKGLYLAFCIPCHDYSELLLKRNRFFQKSWFIKGFIQVSCGSQALDAATIVAVLAQLVKCGQEVGVTGGILPVFGQYKFGCGKLPVGIKLFLNALVLDLPDHRWLGVNLFSLLLQGFERFHIHLLDFNGDYIQVFAKIINGVIVL